MRSFYFTLFLSLFIFAQSNLHAQDLKASDYAALFAKNKITERTWHEVKFAGSAVKDSLIKGNEKFDANGRLIESTEYFAGGKVLAVQKFTYDAKGKMTGCTIEHAFNEMKPVEVKLTYDAKGRVIERVLTEELRNYWTKETTTYNSAGIIVKTQQWFNQNGTLQPLNNKEYPANISAANNSLTYLHDQRSLPVAHQFYNANGKLERAWRYKYSVRK